MCGVQSKLSRAFWEHVRYKCNQCCSVTHDGAEDAVPHSVQAAAQVRNSKHRNARQRVVAYQQNKTTDSKLCNTLITLCYLGLNIVLGLMTATCLLQQNLH